MPSPNLEPLTVTNNDTATKTVVVANARSLSPLVVDSTGQNVTYLPINANYTMDGTESYLNSGWIWPEGQNPFRFRFEYGVNNWRDLLSLVDQSLGNRIPQRKKLVSRLASHGDKF
jgi:hypothetical protein